MLKEAREEKGLTITELVYEIRSEKVTKKTIKRWEEDKEFPNLEMIYKLSEILELNPTELLIFRDRARKLFWRATDQPKDSKGLSENFKENLYYGFQAGSRIFIIVLVAVVGASAMGFATKVYNDGTGRFINTVSDAIDEGINETSNSSNEVINSNNSTLNQSNNLENDEYISNVN